VDKQTFQLPTSRKGGFRFGLHQGVFQLIHATERGTPKDRERIEWKLVTNLPVTCKESAIEKLEWYALRWKIETFHKALKSGCRAEDSELRTAERLANLIAMICILAWRVLWLTMVNRMLSFNSPAFEGG
jgi:hypothetical protein